MLIDLISQVNINIDVLFYMLLIENRNKEVIVREEEL
jgi:hypothetical protein